MTVRIQQGAITRMDGALTIYAETRMDSTDC